MLTANELCPVKLDFFPSMDKTKCEYLLNADNVTNSFAFTFLSNYNFMVHASHATVVIVQQVWRPIRSLFSVHRGFTGSVFI